MIVPLCKFDLSDAEQQRKACHYTNLQPLWKEDHLEKTRRDLNFERKGVLMLSRPSYAGRLKTQLYYWLGKSRPFYINDDYKLELLHIDKENYSAKILITNLRNGEVSSTEMANDRSQDSQTNI